MKMNKVASTRSTRGPDARWAALRKKNTPVKPGKESFVYAVTTTGVFCRPNCRSRLPKRENVLFFDTPDQARQAGFRPCKRCQPDGRDWRETIDAGIQRACQLIEQAEENLPLSALARAAGLSRYHFHRLFKSRLGITPKKYQQARRMNRFKGELRSGRNISTAIYDAGFASSSRAYDGVAAKLGMRPGEYSKGGAGTEIAYGITDTVLGLALVAATTRGVCAISFGSSAAELRQKLIEEFPEAVLSETPESVAGYLARLRSHLAKPQQELSLPLDVRGTPFQCRVWQALREVPRGQTTTYGALARRVGKPGAVRAAASACAANRIALAIPCHRAVRTDGCMGGYRWGLERKRTLLQREASINSKAGLLTRPH